MPSRSYVQVAADGAGKKIANVANTDPAAVDTSGNAQADVTTYQQLVTSVDKRGDWSTDDEIVSRLDAILERLDVLVAAITDD